MISSFSAGGGSKTQEEKITDNEGQFRDTRHPQPHSLRDAFRIQAMTLPEKHLIFYDLGSDTSSTPRRVSYHTLYVDAQAKSRQLLALRGFDVRKPVLLHLEKHWDAILWFWAVILSGAVPVMSSPFSNVQDHRNKHLRHLSQLLESPICVTRRVSVCLFDDAPHTFQIHTVESMDEETQESNQSKNEEPDSDPCRNGFSAEEIDQLAVLMLTSGSTGNVKAVQLSHRQILAAVFAKLAMCPLSCHGSVLNWIGMDHVAALVETHLPAVVLGVDQVHVQAADIIASPQMFLELLSRHRVARTFAPNFFLNKLISTELSTTHNWNLANLAALISGGEANDTKTCIATTQLLTRYGAPSNALQPGFGMTETCAGCIYNLECPDSDIRNGRTVASLGHCVPGLEMRVTGSSSPKSPGDLEVRGIMVFSGYYRNPAATNEAFASGHGWFRTGDKAIIDTAGRLGLIGRSKEVVNINGIKVAMADIQEAVEKALHGTCVARVVCFPSRAVDSPTEQITIAYIPRNWSPAEEELARIDLLMVQACMMVSSSGRPFIFMIREHSLPLLPASSLGKIPVSKMRALLEAGIFDNDLSYHRQRVDSFRRMGQGSLVKPETEEEKLLCVDFAETKGLDKDCLSIDTPIFEMGYSSMDLVKLKKRLSSRLRMPVATILVMKNPTIRLLAAALTSKLAAVQTVTNHGPGGSDYDPVIVLQSVGDKTPLWLVHPGVGEVLVFVGLAQHMSDNRPIYALRARGFEGDQKFFTRITEAVDEYIAAIRHHQPAGPYAVAGYSYGAMLAFEIAKGMEAAGEHIGFLGSFNLPPHIKYRMRQLTWSVCLLHLGQFLGLIDEAIVDRVVKQEEDFSTAPRELALANCMALTDSDRMRELGLNKDSLARWADVSFGLQSMAVDYEPTGSVGVLDIFQAEPLRVAAPSRAQWVNLQLSRWRDFCRTQPRSHDVNGRHYTMLSPEHVSDFAKTLQIALAARGL